MDYRDNPQHRVGVNIKVVEFYSAFWTDFAPPLTMGALRFSELLAARIEEWYPDCERIEAWGDTAGAARAQSRHQTG